MNYKCCIFDLDGTLVNSLPALTRCVNLTLADFGLGPVGEQEVKLMVGDGYQKLIERSLDFCGALDPARYEAALRAYRRYFQEHCLDGVVPYDGIRPMLAQLKEAGMKLAVLTNKPHEQGVETVETVFGPGYFDLVLGEQPGRARKPDPEGVFLILEQLHAAAQQCLYLGDTNTDMLTARNAGVDAAGVLWGFRSREELAAYHPKYLVEHPQEMVKNWLRKL